MSIGERWDAVGYMPSELEIRLEEAAERQNDEMDELVNKRMVHDIENIEKHTKRLEKQLANQKHLVIKQTPMDKFLDKLISIGVIVAVIAVFFIAFKLIGFVNYTSLAIRTSYIDVGETSEFEIVDIDGSTWGTHFIDGYTYYVNIKYEVDGNEYISELPVNKSTLRALITDLENSSDIIELYKIDTIYYDKQYPDIIYNSEKDLRKYNANSELRYIND